MPHPRRAAAQGMPSKKFFFLDILLLRCHATLEPSSPPPAETLLVSLLPARSRQESKDPLGPGVMLDAVSTDCARKVISLAVRSVCPSLPNISRKVNGCST
ncbi:hypothetical protein BC567DRAFT_223452 [Phyllosticta citribraziliensis]